MMKFKQVLAGVAASVLLLSVAGCGNGGTYKAGTYTGTGQGKDGPVKVQVTVTKDKIKGVKVLRTNDNKVLADEAEKKVTKEIVKDQSVKVDVVSGATHSSNGIIEGAKKALKKAGASESQLNKAAKKKDAKAQTAHTDVAVVGAGAAGTAAALAARQSGANVVLLEKTASPMGAGTLAGGMFAADSAQQKAQHKTVSKQWLYDKYMDASQGYMNSVLVRKVIDQAGPTVDWLNKNGADMKLVDAGTGGSYAHQGDPATLHGYQKGGTKAIKALQSQYKKDGGKLYFSTPAKKLLTNSKHQVTGVVATKANGAKFTVHAKKVIIATGGYGGNQKMLNRYLGKPNTKGQVLQNKGDGLKMAWAAGAGKEGTDTTHYFWETFTNSEIKHMTKSVGAKYFALTAFSAYPNLRVNVQGQRFSDETDATLYARRGAEIASQPKQTEYVVFDTAMLNKIKEKGTVAIEDQYGKWKNNPQSYMEFNEPSNTKDSIKRENTPTNFEPLLSQLAGNGVVFKSDSLADLAKQMGVSQTNFKQSVSQYNGAITQGKDTQFFANPKRLISVKTGPYYAVKYVARNLGTLGGVRINDQIQATKTNGKAIPNLYVAGADAGGMYGKIYVDFEGGTLGFAYTSGRLAGLNAAKAIN
ncbi:FAD-dependent oxidoreductase [Lactiplantibacillus modestisalitolerans]|uniref:Urocanate reductase n=1 Tax=Lactiplantibacillus modestisalitolerans TaxID=1457219 RepID=A0ABV5WV04_9LACO|nr:FAD-dependent oxidoreductase [Lactiplantibacillus modestisalitolerans]